jgi:superfamily II DNA or RNA helicase
LSVKIVIAKNLKVSGLSEHLTNRLIQKLKITNPKWLENERMGRWNGNVPKILKFYDNIDQDTLLIPRGYIRQLILLLRHEKLDYTLIDQRRILPLQTFTFNGQLKPFQKEAVKALHTKDFGTLCAPTGSGKTVMALHLISLRSQPALIIVHTKDLAYQWIDRARHFLNIPFDEIGLIGAGKNVLGRSLTVALIQSLYKCAHEISQNIGYLIVDECHRTPSRTFTEAVTAFDSRYMLGLTATPWRRDRLSQLIFWHLGDVHHEVKKHQLVAQGEILKVEVVYRETRFTPYFDPVNEYSKMLAELTADDDRNRMICEDIIKEMQLQSGVCLVLSDRKKHCETLRTLLKYKFNVPAELLTGDLSSGQRKEVLDRLHGGQVKILIATGQLIGEGFDHKNLATLFLATPIRFSGRVIQYLGRVLRPSKSKSKARVYDYVDINVDVLKAAAQARQRVYAQ